MIQLLNIFLVVSKVGIAVDERTGFAFYVKFYVYVKFAEIEIVKLKLL